MNRRFFFDDGSRVVSDRLLVPLHPMDAFDNDLGLLAEHIQDAAGLSFVFSSGNDNGVIALDSEFRSTLVHPQKHFWC